MKYETMINILFLLLSRGKTTSKYIASRFDISVRTVMRYIEAISLANVPLISDVGRNGGYYIADSFRLPASFFTEKEFGAVLDILSGYNSQIPSKTLDSAINKLNSIKKPTSSKFEVRTGNIIIDGSSWNGNDDVKNTLKIIEESIENDVTVKIKYFDRHGESSLRDIDPHIIILKQGEWYVYAFCHLREQFRMFKVARIIFASKTDENFTKRKTDFNLSSLSKWFEKMEEETVELEFDASAESDAVEWLGIGSIYKRTKEKIFASAKLTCDKWLVSKILSFGGSVRVITPASLKDDVIKVAKKIAEMN